MNESKKERGFMTAKDSINDKKIKTRSDLISTSSSMKCSIRIRKSKKVMWLFFNIYFPKLYNNKQ